MRGSGRICSADRAAEAETLAKGKHHTGNGFGLNLAQAVRMFPTPTARDWKDGSAKSCRNVPVNGLLGRAVHQWPTPHANCHTGAGQAPNKQGGENLQTAAGGSLNPRWVEWLMGFPDGWTASSNSETRSSRSSRKSSAERSSKR
jgi:hypothetical protein